MNSRQSDITAIRRALGFERQSDLADATGITRATINRLENRRRGLSIEMATKAAPVLGMPASVLYGASHLQAILRAKDEGAILEATAADKLISLVRTLLEKFEGLEDTEEGTALVDALEAALAETTGVAVKSLRDGYTAMDYDVDLDGGTRDIFGRRVKYAINYEDYGDKHNTADLGDPVERRFEDVDSFAESPNQIDGEDDGRDFYGRRVRPLS